MEIPSYKKKSIYIAYSIGSNDKGKIEYETPQLIYAQTEDVKSSILKEDIGYVPNYDRLILVPYGDKSQYIDGQTLLWVNVEPNTEMSNMDYKIERVGDVIDNNIILYCNLITPNTTPIYFERNDTIYQTKVDLVDLVALIPLNKYLPIDKNTKVWFTKPNNNLSTKNLVKLVKKDKLSNSYKLTFEKVE